MNHNKKVVNKNKNKKEAKKMAEKDLQTGFIKESLSGVVRSFFRQYAPVRVEVEVNKR